jgi:hypothetical protein
MYTEPYLRLWNSNVACITHQTDIEYRVNADPVLSICLMGYPWVIQGVSAVRRQQVAYMTILGKAGLGHYRIAQKSTAGPQVYTKLWSQGGVSSFRVGFRRRGVQSTTIETGLGL